MRSSSAQDLVEGLGIGVRERGIASKSIGDSFQRLSGSCQRACSRIILHLAADGQEELDHADAVAHQHALEGGGLAQEGIGLVGRTELHHALDAGAVVPGASKNTISPAAGISTA